jgi:hypothetical protein
MKTGLEANGLMEVVFKKTQYQESGAKRIIAIKKGSIQPDRAFEVIYID